MPVLKEIGLLPYLVLPGKVQMALDQWMFDTEGTWLRFYGWARPTLSLGRNQKPEPDMDLAAAKAAGIDLVRRASGGQAVLHHLELTYSFAASVPPMASSILQSYSDIRQPLLAGLSALGIPLECAPETAKFRPQSSVCFAKAAGHEILFEQRKLVGSAQRRQKGRLLQHGSILLELDLDLHQTVWPERAPEIWQRETATLSQALGDFEIGKIREQLEQAFAEAFSARLVPRAISPEEMGRLEAAGSRFEL